MKAFEHDQSLAPNSGMVAASTPSATATKRVVNVRVAMPRIAKKRPRRLVLQLFQVVDLGLVPVLPGGGRSLGPGGAFPCGDRLGQGIHNFLPRRILPLLLEL